MRALRVIFCLVVIFGFGACGPGRPLGTARPQMVAAPDSVSAMLAESADRASRALETLSAVEYSKTSNIAVAPIADAPVELRRAMTVRWTGPVEPLLKALSDRASYKFVSLGAPPPNALVVNVDAQNQPLMEILRDLGLQLGRRADIRISESTQTIELHYAPKTGANEVF